MESNRVNSFEQLENGTPTDKVIHIKSVYKTGKTTVQPVPDGMGWYMGIERLSQEQKNQRQHWAEPNSKFVLKEGTTFDLNIEAQRIAWEWIKHQPCLALSEEDCQFTPGAEFYVFIEGKEAEKNVSRRERKYKAIKYIMDDNSVNYPAQVELLGINMDGESPMVIKDFLLEKAENDPQAILDIYESHDISLRLLLIKAKKKGVITIDQGGIYRYGNTTLGMTETSCINWMQDRGNKHLVEMLERDVNPEYFAKKDEESTPETTKTEGESQPTKTRGRGSK